MGDNPTLEGILSWDGDTGAYGAAVDGGSAFPGGIACECCASMPFEHEGRLYNAVRINNDNTRDFHLARTDESGAWTESLDIDPTNWTINPARLPRPRSPPWATARGLRLHVRRRRRQPDPQEHRRP